jgi:hypothetical protein
VATNWRNVAKPQASLYDMAVIAAKDRLWQPITHCTRTPRSFLGEIYVNTDRSITQGEDTFLPSNMDCTHEWADQQVRYLSQWTDGWRSMQMFLDELWPFFTKSGGKGCMSGHHVLSEKLPIHAVFVSVNDLGGCAQGMYHEMAHLRLESLGIGIDKHDGTLLLNPPDELYNSSVRFDTKRPMSAVLHGLYAWLMFTENDYQNYTHGLFTLQDFRDYSERNIPKIQNGLDEVLAHARWTDDGGDFMVGIRDWANDLVARCSEVFGTK